MKEELEQIIIEVKSRIEVSFSSHRTNYRKELEQRLERLEQLYSDLYGY